MERHATIHPTRVVPGETLIEDLFRSSKGFLLDKRVVQVTLNASKVQQEMEYYKKRVVIAYFVGGKQLPKSTQEWMSSITKDLSEEFRIGRELEHGFFQVIGKDEAATQKLLMHTPYSSR